MSNRKIVTAVRELMATVRQSHAQIMSRVRHLEQVEEHDRICGCWTHPATRLRATVARMNTGYQATVFRGAKCQDQMTVLPFGAQLHVNDTAGTRPLLVVHDPERQTLLLGKHGLFHRETGAAPDAPASTNEKI